MKSICIFGTGSSAERAWDFLRQQPAVQIVAIVDNDVKKQGQTWRGLEIRSASSLLTNKNWDEILVASSWHANIIRQLMDMGIDGANLAVFEPWISKGLISGIERWRWLQIFPDQLEGDYVIPGFEGDSRVLELLKQLGFHPRIVLDVGASNGVWSITCSRFFPDAEYFLVEPLVKYDGHFADGYDYSWNRLSLALGAENRSVELNVPDSDEGVYDASIAVRSNIPSEKFQTYKVEQARFDTLLSEGKLKIPDLVKLDVQGFEAEVLRGASSMWGNVEVFMVELSFRRFWKESKLLHEMIALFEEKGYLPFEFYHPYRNAEGLQSQIDCVFLKKDGALAKKHGLWND